MDKEEVFLKLLVETAIAFRPEKCADTATTQEKINCFTRNNMRWYGMPKEMAEEIAKKQIEGKEKAPWN